jgi:hypothetical protein
MKTTSVALAGALAALAPAAAAADPWDAPFTIQIGAYNAQAETDLRLDSSSGAIGTAVSFEGHLGGEDRKTVPTFDMLWRFNPRHAMEMSVVSLRRDGDTTLTATLNFGDRTFPINSAIHSTFDSDIVRVAYRWSFVHDERAEAGLLLGAHWTQMKTSVAATGSTVSLSEEASVDYPLPTVGLMGSARIGENWRIAGFGQLLKLKIEDYDGEIVNFSVGLEWMFTRAMYAGLGYDYYKYNLVSSKDRARGEFNYEFDGPKLYFGWNFR